MSAASNGRAREHRVAKWMTDRGATWTRVGRIDALAVESATASAHRRFWSKVEAAPAPDCWLWTGALNSRGYGKFFVAKEEGRTVLIAAHRWAFLMLRGDVDGLLLDHLCRNPACVNPWHLEPVTNAVNLGRQVSGNGSKTTCKRGHAFTPGNTGRQNGGHRYCRECKRMTDSRRWRAA